MSHAYAREGGAEVMLSVNCNAYNLEYPVLEVTAHDTEGRAGSRDTVRVRVVGVATPRPPEAPIATSTPTSTTAAPAPT